METLNDLTKTENTDEITGGTDQGRAGRRWKTRGYPEEGTTEEKKKGKQETTQQEGLKTQQAATTDLILPNMLFFVMLSLQLHILHFPQDILLPVVHF